MSRHILIVEDEPEIREMISFTLQRAGFKVSAVESAEQAQGVLYGYLPDLVVIDWMLPGMSGVDLAKQLRREELTKSLGLLMLTARGEEADKLTSFESGVDDYLTKPFSPKELVARIRALLRRSGAPEAQKLSHGTLVLDLDAHKMTIDGKRVHIGPTEFRLLEFFLNHPDRAFERSQLLDRVWGRGVYLEDRTVDVHVLRLRKLLKPFNLEHIVETVRGVGYRYATES